MNERGREVANRRVRELTVKLDIERLGRAVEEYRSRFGTPPRSLRGLVTSGILRQIPVDPDGNPYRYDRRTGGVSSATVYVLGGE
jgi:hypothetical protein